MMNQTFLVPANSKRSALIFGFFKPVDLIIFGVGTALSLILLMIFPVTKLWAVIVTLIPIVTAGFLVFPIPNYHNVRTLIGEVYNYYFVNRRKYIWRGWCYQYEQSDESNEPNAQ